MTSPERLCSNHEIVILVGDPKEKYYLPAIRFPLGPQSRRVPLVKSKIVLWNFWVQWPFKIIKLIFPVSYWSIFL